MTANENLTARPPHSWLYRRRWFMLSLIVGVSIYLWADRCSSTILWDGRYELNVHLVAPKKIRSVAYVSCGASGEFNEEYQFYEMLGDYYGSRKFEHFEGTVMLATVSSWGREYVHRFRTVNTEGRMTHLAIAGIYEDGSRFSKFVALPDGKLPPEITVEIP